MSIVSVHSLSELLPVKFAYKQEPLASNTTELSNNLKYTKHEAFNNLKDLAISNKNVMFLTDVKNLNHVFEETNKELLLTENLGSFYLKPKNENTKIKVYNNKIYVGGNNGEDLLLTLQKIQDSIFELKIDKTKKVIVDSVYPYDLLITEEELKESEIHRQQFEIDMFKNTMTIKCKIPEGYRYISYGSDLQLRANGLMLNNTVANSYLFTPEFITSVTLNRGYDPSSKHVRYYNSGENGHINVTTLDIKEQKYMDTNLLITSTVDQISSANVAILKTNQI